MKMPKDETSVQFDSGARRSSVVANLGRLSPVFLNGVAARGDLGAEKYGESNYRKGLGEREFVRQLFAHALAHLAAEANYYDVHGEFRVGLEDEIAAVGWNVMALMEARELADYARRFLGEEVERLGAAVPAADNDAGDSQRRQRDAREAGRVRVRR